MSLLKTKILSFEFIKELYASDLDFKEIYSNCITAPKGPFYVQDGSLFKGNRLCIPQSRFRYLLIKEVHGGSLSGHFNIQKTLDMLALHFFWPKMLGTIGKFILKWETCIKEKLTFS